MSENKIHFKTLAAAYLFEHIIKGQLSDGMWENTRPLNHWEFWCNAEVVIDGKAGHEGWPSKTNYNLNALKPYIKDEMIEAVRIDNPDATEKDLNAALKEIKQAMTMKA